MRKLNYKIKKKTYNKTPKKLQKIKRVNIKRKYNYKNLNKIHHFLFKNDKSINIIIEPKKIYI